MDPDFSIKTPPNITVLAMNIRVRKVVASPSDFEVLLHNTRGDLRLLGWDVENVSFEINGRRVG